MSPEQNVEKVEGGPENQPVSQSSGQGSSLQYFFSLIDARKPILVVGSGNGDLLEKIKNHGYQGVGLEEDAALCKQSHDRGFDVIEGSIKNVASLKIPKDISGVWAGVAFNHIDEVDLTHILGIIHLILPDKAPFLLAVPRGEGVKTEATSDGKTLTTQFYTEEEFEKLLAEKNFKIGCKDFTPNLLTAVVTT
ncbi:methionine biosynthesis protein MetW [Bdellovibrio svalbardensis]|uniref:Methyltransferase domain-containing protein n=1 Tax=Bdellovibrio svalbardensis TaxID=2972972 RepID=A0ABT6DMZ6_9BACT|nr:methionine biosynthesis protein MetW [Bdellovibrio svalbardensis]MDG0818243.1 hypothetical protein [Bdellovibrio svalbardensis]